MGEKHTPITDELNQLCRTEEDWDYSMLWESNAKLEVENRRLREALETLLTDGLPLTLAHRAIINAALAEGGA